MDDHNPDRISASVPKVEDGEYLTTNQGVRISDNQNSLKAGARGPTLLEDFVLREKITHFDHERIPERVVHARGAAAHGMFQVYSSLAEFTTASFLQDPSVKTPVFVRFSTVAGSRGSADTVRDARGFATKFYTADGNFDLVGNNIPVFFIQDAIKFPDLVHAIKPEPHNEIPQASTAHDSFWDFISLVPETMHMIMWVMSDRGIPRSFRTMEGFGVNTYRLINAQGRAHFVKFHWKPLLGVHSLVWDEAKKLTGADPDFHRRDLWDAIELGNYPEYEFGLQLIEEGAETQFDFDVLDATKVWPEELVPVRRVGKLTLTHNPDNFFAETEQAAFHPGHIVPGIDFSNDPLLQGRLFSYLDTQLTRLGGPNFAQLPINQPLTDVNNNQQDGIMRFRNKAQRVNYEPNSLAGGCPMQAPENLRGFVSYPEHIDAPKTRIRSLTFADHYSQAAMFWQNQTDWEKDHLVQALRFELGKVVTVAIRERMVEQLSRVDSQLANLVAEGIGVTPPPVSKPAAKSQVAPELSLANSVKGTIKSRTVAILAADGVNGLQISQMRSALAAAGARSDIISTRLGKIKNADGSETSVDKTLLTTGSVLYDAVYVPGGQESVANLQQIGDARHFLAEAYKHGKAIAGTNEGATLISTSLGPTIGAASATSESTFPGVIAELSPADFAKTAQRFVEAIGQHRFPTRASVDSIPA